MVKRNRALQQVPNETTELKNRLFETEETLRAIRQCMVDAFVVTRSNGEQVVTLSGAEFPYRMMVESMNEGAATLIPDGTIFYCNPRFAEMVQIEPKKLIGVRFQDLIPPDEQEAFEVIFRGGGQNGMRGEFCLQTAQGNCVPVQLSVYQLTTEAGGGISIIATNIAERIQAEEKIRSLASKLTMAEQNERHRISQILHDDLQQCLYALKTHLFLFTSTDEEIKNPTAMQADLDQIQDLISNAIAITRNLSMELSPVVLKGEGLAEALGWLCAHMKEQYGLQAKLEAKGDFIPLQDHMRVLLFQSVRELLFNIVKHAGTSQAAIMLERIDSHGRITIRDWGKGSDPEAVMEDPKSAHGLLLVRDRLSLMGGEMKMTSKPGEGT
ncbi:MAG TPA: PAS domain-containing protein, partial [Anaerolineales bacterium]